MQLDYTLRENWPPLAWLARCPRSHGTVEVWHGRQVEVHPDWFCEAVWDGAYADGGFDRTDLVFGSGGRRRPDGIHFVTAGTTVDRVQVLDAGNVVWVSNSLSCLLAAVDAKLDPTYPHYFRDFSSIRMGLKRYHRTVSTSAGPVRLVYFHNLRWDGRMLHDAPKVTSERQLDSFRSYRSFLGGALERLAANAGDAARRRPYRLLGTASSGYDSPAVATLARHVGLRDVICFDRANTAESDDGQEIAAILGLNSTVVPRDAWRRDALNEVPFLAADAKGEDVFFRSAEGSLGGTVLLTGFYGDKVWGMRDRGLGPDIVRNDPSGLSLTEYRLHVGFLHCPVPFIGVRQIQNVHRITRSPELAPWDVGGAYSRPISRRLLEEAGVPRHLFGTHKKAASVLFFDRSTFLSPESRANYVAWLEEHSPAALAAPKPGPLRRGAVQIARLLDELAHAEGSGDGLRGRLAGRLAVWGRWEPLFQWLFPWAVERTLSRYRARPDARRRRISDLKEAPGIRA